VSETRVINIETGGEKCSKPEQYSLLPWDLMGEVARLYSHGSRKYARDNWRKGFDWSLSFDAMMRHSSAFWSGESEHEVEAGDPETLCHHLASVIFHAFTLMYFEVEHPNLDDRPKRTVRD